jgi:2-polyprenyl-6-methoxyphenol hydroxylase-like FAD-dependent oxidoreductase
VTAALVIGAGIGGCVAAMALQRIGVDATVYEAYAGSADDLGAFFTVGPNGMDALHAVEADELVTANSFPVSGSELMELSGRVVARVDLRDLVPGIAGFQTLRRAALNRLLRDEAVRRGIRVETGKRLTGAEVRGRGGVTALFADGSRVDGDLLIGADGIHSVTRKLVVPDDPGPRFNGFITICGRARVPAPHAVAVSVARVVVGKRKFFGHTTEPGGDTWWYATLPSRELTREQLATTTADTWRCRVSDAFPEGSPVPAVVAATGADIVAYCDYYITGLPTWHNSAMVIVGDAAHVAPPHAGQGASMAIEDGVELARCLRDVPETGAAFEAFERLRRARVEHVVADALADMATTTVVQRLARRIRARIRPTRHGELPDKPNKIEWLYRHHIEWDAPVGTGPGRHDRP